MFIVDSHRPVARFHCACLRLTGSIIWVKPVKMAKQKLEIAFCARYIETLLL